MRAFEQLGVLPAAVNLTDHARRRGNQRGIAPQLVPLVIRYGRRHRGRSACHHFFGQAETRRYRALLGRLTDRLEGVVVVVTEQGHVLTVYRNHGASRRLRRLRD